MATSVVVFTNYGPSVNMTNCPSKDDYDKYSIDSGVQDEEVKDEPTNDGLGIPIFSVDRGMSGGSNPQNECSKPLMEQNDSAIIITKTNRNSLDTPFLTQNMSIEEKDEKETHNAKGYDKLFWIKICVIFSVLDVLLLATILVVEYGIPPLHGSDHTPPREHCLNCSDVYLTHDDMSDNIYNFTIRDGGLCCSNNQTRLIQKYVLKRYRSDEAKASSKANFPKRTALHVELEMNDTNSEKAGTNQKLKWRRRDALVSGNLTLSEDGFSVQIGRTGLYFVSPMVVFNDDKGDEGESDLDPMLLKVYRVRKENELLLLEGKETHCANSESKCNIPSSAQGVFKFETGDNIVVKVTKPCGLVLKEKLNHFDIYLI